VQEQSLLDWKTNLPASWDEHDLTDVSISRELRARIYRSGALETDAAALNDDESTPSTSG
jgi:hypothetical protein